MKIIYVPRLGSTTPRISRREFHGNRRGEEGRRKEEGEREGGEARPNLEARV